MTSRQHNCKIGENGGKRQAKRNQYAAQLNKSKMEPKPINVQQTMFGRPGGICVPGNQNDYKIDKIEGRVESKWNQNGAKMHQNVHQVRQRAHEAAKEPNLGIWNLFPGCLLEAKIGPKSIFCGKMTPRGRVSIEFCCSCCVASFLGRIVIVI